MSVPTGQPPSFFDWADGSIDNGGTPTASNALVVVQINPIQPSFEEDPDSPQIEFSEQGTIKHSFKTDYDYALFLATGLHRGVILEDSSGNFSRVLSCQVNKLKGNKANLIIIAESLMTVDLPPEEFSIDPIEFSPAIEKHPRYFIYDPTNVAKPYVIMTPYDLALVTSQITASNYLTQQMFKDLVAQIPNQNDPDLTRSQTTDAKRNAAAQELITKIQRGIEAPYIPAFRVTWSHFFFYGAVDLGSGNVDPNLNPGGFIQDPTTIIPPSFWSVDGSGDPSTNILLPSSLGGAMDTSLCPTFYDLGISWLRESDSITYQRTWFKITLTWIGGPIGQWDQDLYSNNPSPYLP